MFITISFNFSWSFISSKVTFSLFNSYRIKRAQLVLSEIPLYSIIVSPKIFSFSVILFVYLGILITCQFLCISFSINSIIKLLVLLFIFSQVKLGNIFSFLYFSGIYFEYNELLLSLRVLK